MATWREMSEKALKGAELLLREADYRGCVSRAYYAAYCAAAGEIVQKVTSFSYSWQNPSHARGNGMNGSIGQTGADEKAVIAAVRKLLKSRHPGGVTLEVVPDGVRHDQDWWYVPVRPSAQPARRYEYYETLAEVEIELQKSEKVTVLLVPAAP